jgi:hypothetical protein
MDKDDKFWLFGKKFAEWPYCLVIIGKGISQWSEYLSFAKFADAEG